MIQSELRQATAYTLSSGSEGHWDTLRLELDCTGLSEPSAATLNVNEWLHTGSGRACLSPGNEKAATEKRRREIKRGKACILETMCVVCVSSLRDVCRVQMRKVTFDINDVVVGVCKVQTSVSSSVIKLASKKNESLARQGDDNKSQQKIFYRRHLTHPLIRGVDRLEDYLSPAFQSLSNSPFVANYTHSHTHMPAPYLFCLA